MASNYSIGNFEFDKTNKLIIIKAPVTTLTIQQLLNAIREYEATSGSLGDIIDNRGGIDISAIANATGKQDLGGGVLVGITLELLDDWRIKFEDRAGPSTVQCKVTGGNLVATNNYDDNPIAPSLYVFVTLTSSSSATIAELDIINLKNSIESQKATHSGFGNVWYWDPYSGNDLNNGTSPSLATLTFAKAQTLASNNNSDIIFVMNSSPSAQITTTEVLTITSNRLYVRASPQTITLAPNISAYNVTAATSSYAIGIVGTGVEVSGFTIAPSVPIHFGISVSGSFALVHNNQIKENIYHGIRLNSSSGSNIRSTYIDGAIEDAIIVDNYSYNTILGPNLKVEESGQNGISIEISKDTFIESDNFILNSASAGIGIDSSASGTYIKSGNVINSNVGFNISDSGIGTIIEDQNIQDSLYNDNVKIDENGEAGTQYPIGTFARPVNNVEDALIIANRLNTHNFQLVSGNITSGVGYSLSGFNIVANASNPTSWDIRGTNVDQSAFEGFTLSGWTPAGNYTYYTFCDLTVSGLYGYFDRCGIVGLNIMDNAATDVSVFDNCAGLNYDPTLENILDFNNSPFGAQFIEFDGTVKFKNHAQSATSTLDFDSGIVTIDPSCSGTFFIRGNGRVINNSNAITSSWIDTINSSSTGVSVIGGVTVTGVTANVDYVAAASAVWNYAISAVSLSSTIGGIVKNTHAYNYGKWEMVNNRLFIYDLDGVQLLQAYNLYDSNGTPSLTGVVKRVPL